MNRVSMTCGKISSSLTCIIEDAYGDEKQKMKKT